jgi:hypothetical protein
VLGAGVGVVTDSGLGASVCTFGVAPIVIPTGSSKMATRLHPKNDRMTQICFTDIGIPKEFGFPRIVRDFVRFFVDLATIKVYLMKKSNLWLDLTGAGWGVANPVRQRVQ